MSVAASKKKKLSNEQLGKEFEDDCVVEFKKLLRLHPFYFDRIYDTKSASRYIPVRPGDFYIGHVGIATVLECKASQVHASLKNGMGTLVKNGQIAAMRLFERSGNNACYIFRSEVSNTIEVWDGRQIFEARLKSTPLPDGGYLKSVPRDQLYEILYWTFIGQYE